MKAAIYREYQKPFAVEEVPDPTPTADGVVISVKATGVCRSDWHGWMGHDPDVTLPNVPGHEMSGVVEAVGKDVKRWLRGDRVTLPFACGCGHCFQCASGNHQICDNLFMPGFTHWGSFAEFVAIDFADVNLVAVPEEIEFVTAAGLGCRFVTSFRAVVDQGRGDCGEWVAVHGCGGVGLSAIMIAAALGANPIAVDISEEKLKLARSVGAVATVNAGASDDVAGDIRELTRGGAHLSIDALGSPVTCFNSVSCLRKRGRHVQVGLLLADQANSPLPMDRVIANELEVLGSHGMQAHRYHDMMVMIQSGKLAPQRLVGSTISLSESPAALVAMDQFQGTGIMVIDSFT